MLNLFLSVILVIFFSSGDTYPISPLGKTVAGITFLGGLAIIAFPIAILGSKFLDLYLESEAKKQKREAAKLEKIIKRKQSEEEKLAEAYPFYPVPVRKMFVWKLAIDQEILKLEGKVENLKQQAKTIERALQLFDWERNPALIDVDFVDKLSQADRDNNLPFKTN